jgi:arabinose-5-phosphate isomerase
MDYLEKARRVIALELGELQRLHDRVNDSFVAAVEAIKACVENRGKVVVVGVGKSGHIGEKIAATLTSTGSPAVVLNPLNALHGDLGVVADGDVVLGLSASGETDELVNILPALSRLDVRLIAMTGNPKSFLAQNSHIHLDVHVEQEACPLNLAPTSSSTVMLVLGDALAMVLLEARGFQKEDFARFHPGGRLGRTLLLKVEQIMRGANQMAVVSPKMTIRDVLLKMAAVRAGMAVAVDEQGKMEGIFTQGDFGRQLRVHPDLLEHSIDEFLIRRPVTIRAGKLAVEVLHLIEQHRIDDLLVVDENNRPVGVVDTQDLARHRLV